MVKRMEFLGIDVFQVVSVIVALTITYITAKIVTKFLEKLFEKTPLPENIEKSIAKYAKYAVYFVGLLVIISLMGVDISSIILGLGAFSIAISFATSTIIQNFVSGALIFGDKAFKVGDTIRIQSFEGKVYKIGIRTTILEDEGGNLIFVPNSLFISNAVVRKRVNNKIQTVKAG